MVELNDIVSANELLVKLGGEDQLPKLTAAAIERYADLQSRVDKALDYVKSSPSKNSVSMQKIASILDGAVAPVEEKVAVVKPKSTPKKPTPQKKKTSGAGSRQSGLASRPRSERLAFRNWAREQGFTIPTAGPVPQGIVNAYDSAQEELRKMREAKPEEPVEGPSESA